MSGNPLEKILSPASIAIVGASNNPMKMGSMQLMNLIHSGFSGDVLPVHPTEKDIFGKKAYADIGDLPYAPDLAMLVVPTALVPEMVAKFGKLGTRRAVIISAGFRETGPTGQNLERDLVKIARPIKCGFSDPIAWESSIITVR